MTCRNWGKGWIGNFLQWQLYIKSLRLTFICTTKLFLAQYNTCQTFEILFFFLFHTLLYLAVSFHSLIFGSSALGKSSAISQKRSCVLCSSSSSSPSKNCTRWDGGTAVNTETATNPVHYAVPCQCLHNLLPLLHLSTSTMNTWTGNVCRTHFLKI